MTDLLERRNNYIKTIAESDQWKDILNIKKNMYKQDYCSLFLTYTCLNFPLD